MLLSNCPEVCVSHNLTVPSAEADARRHVLFLAIGNSLKSQIASVWPTYDVMFKDGSVRGLLVLCYSIQKLVYLPTGENKPCPSGGSRHTRIVVSKLAE